MHNKNNQTYILNNIILYLVIRYNGMICVCVTGHLHCVSVWGIVQINGNEGETEQIMRNVYEASGVAASACWCFQHWRQRIHWAAALSGCQICTGIIWRSGMERPMPSLRDYPLYPYLEYRELTQTWAWQPVRWKFYGYPSESAVSGKSEK